MDSIKKLVDAAKECMSDLRSMESKLSVAQGNISSYESQAAEIKKEIDKLNKKKAELVSFLRDEEERQKKEHEAKIKELDLKSDALDKERGAARIKENHAAEALKSATNEKLNYMRLSNEMEQKIKEINEKRERLNAVLR